jgi:hypothetical protein
MIRDSRDVRQRPQDYNVRGMNLSQDVKCQNTKYNLSVPDKINKQMDLKVAGYEVAT